LSAIDTTLPALPPGYHGRPATFDDLVAVVALLNACSRDLLGVDEATPEIYQREWRAPGVNLETDRRVVVAPDGQLVGYMEVWDLFDPHVKVHSWGRVHPAQRGRGIGTYLLAWADGRARQALDKAPTGTRVALLNEALGHDAPAQALFRACDYALRRHAWRMEIALEAPPPAPVWPAGIAVRTLVQGQEERAVIAAVRDAFRDHWGYVERPFEEEVAMWTHFAREDPDFDPSLWFLAMAGDEIAGMSLCQRHVHDDREMGWVGTLGVRRPWRRLGLGLALLQHSFGEFYQRGKRKVGLGVDAQSLTGATRLYERAGMHVAREYVTFEKELRPGVDLSTQSVEA
jgi:mycothiol synthase